MSRLLLCTDMDRTVIPNGRQEEALNARQAFAEFCAQPWVTLVYVTGRHLALMQEAIQEFQLPQPDYAITDVGTRIYHQRENRWHSMSGWQNEIDQAWLNVEPKQIIELLADVKGLKLQEAEKQNAHKVSFYVDLDQLDEPRCLSLVEAMMASLKIQSNLIWSIDETSHKGLLDILPPKANKLHAIEFLKQFLHYGEAEVVFAGDSGNDLPVLVSPIQSVLVANATEAVKRQAVQLAKQQGTQQQFYQAQNRSNNDGNYSAGILQGVFHYLPELKPSSTGN
ncbi:HAD-IIB family hydrolase [Thiomicrorhabdus sp. zzn3]|uniref:HAD-IIB family hydrolase n=1 Tax=Thiomicrorhabdus sp. zzn3 TaxID=3039775 RepID=UPI0024364AA9|nr:HAD-IIB family hydrolase [Thiomicrorhabdus sp. zzn3]MDG6778268.1 HAD-IIB family hydrolase [Thiomicrorhabdus sp. zzn3]